jgi:pSer/pThr/pTyr-binding forkhead associated (FHA) protein
MTTCTLCGGHPREHRCRRCGEEPRARRLDETDAAGVAVAHEAYIFSEMLELPCQIFRGRDTTLGRDASNAIVLPVQLVSRYHALVKWHGEGFTLFDLASTNGTYLNRERVQEERLCPGDAIGIGPFELRFDTEIAAPGGESPVIDTAMLTLPGSFAGEIVHVGLAEVWQMIELSQKTGSLAVRCGGHRGFVYFARGVPCHAEWDELRGNAAALAVLALEKGTFSFSKEEQPGLGRTISGSSGALLFEAARLSDEAQRSPPGGATRRYRRIDTCSG